MTDHEKSCASMFLDNEEYEMRKSKYFPVAQPNQNQISHPFVTECIFMLLSTTIQLLSIIPDILSLQEVESIICFRAPNLN